MAALLSWYDNEETLRHDALQHAVTRIRAIALVHGFLTQDASLTTVNIATVVEHLVGSLVQNMTPGGSVEVALDMESIYMPSRQGTSLASIVNQLVVNALEHGFAASRPAALTVSLHGEKHLVTLVVRDNGVGLSRS